MIPGELLLALAGEVVGKHQDLAEAVHPESAQRGERLGIRRVEQVVFGDEQDVVVREAVREDEMLDAALLELVEPRLERAVDEVLFEGLGAAQDEAALGAVVELADPFGDLHCALASARNRELMELVDNEEGFVVEAVCDATAELLGRAAGCDVTGVGDGLHRAAQTGRGGHAHEADEELAALGSLACGFRANALKAAAQQTKDEQLKLAREKFEAAERRENAAKAAVADNKLSDEERMAKLREIYGI